MTRKANRGSLASRRGRGSKKLDDFERWLLIRHKFRGNRLVAERGPSRSFSNTGLWRAWKRPLYIGAKGNGALGDSSQDWKKSG